MKKYFIWISVFLLLTACDNQSHFKDLKEYVATVSDNALKNSKRKQSTFTIQSPTPATYHKEASRTPFEEQQSAASNGAKTAIKHPVNMYPLNLLLFVGTVTENNKVWGYIATPDKKLYQVTIGDIIGDHDGKVSKISSRELEVTEPVYEEGRQATQRIVTLQLKEEN